MLPRWWIRFYEARNRLTCPWSNRRRSSWSSTSKPQRRSASRCRHHCSPAPTRSSNDGVDGPLAASECQTAGYRISSNEEPSMGEVRTIGLDLAKHVFQVHGVDAEGSTVLRKQLRRAQVLAFFSRLPPCLVGLEACATAHYWARELRALGHEVRLMPAQYVKA